MIWLQMNDDSYEYDVRGLLMAFYPNEEIVKTQEAQPVASWRRHLTVKMAPEGIEVVLVCRWDDEEGPEETSLTGRKATEGAGRRETKSMLKRMVYDILSQDTGKVLPWGTLTGIRPVKIAMGLLEEGESAEEIAAYMKQEYLVSDAKARLSARIAEREKRILADIDYREGYSLYVGIPFCPTTCLYCSFTSYPLSRWQPRVDEYLDALEKELAYTAKAFAGRKLNTVYFGGGTPTTLSAEQLDRLLTFIEENFDFSYLREYTVEAGRPDSITEDKLCTLKKHGIGRISINPQTMNQKTLDLIGRRHTVEQIREAYRLARSLGFDDINMDLILGLPEETIDDVRRTMEEIEILAPDNMTVHSLAIKRAARLNILWEQYAHMTMENSDETMAVAAGTAERLGLSPYYLYRQKNMAGNLENVGYAADGKEGIYNILIMEEKQSIAAVGAGATTKAVRPDGRIERADNVKDIDLYLSRVDEMIERKRRLFDWM